MAVQRCANCVMPRSYARCSPDGVCAFCLDDNRRLNYKDEDALVAVFDTAKQEARSRGSDFDCLCAVSGGKDSTYAMHQCVAKYGLRYSTQCHDRHGLERPAPAHRRRCLHRMRLGRLCADGRQRRCDRSGHRPGEKRPRPVRGRGQPGSHHAQKHLCRR